MDPAHYRARLFFDLCQTLVVPGIALSVFLTFAEWHLGFFSVPVHIIFIIGWASAKGAISKFVQDRDARRLGAKSIPRIVGKWPGNFDILLKMLGAFKTSYVLDVYLQLFEEYQCTTLNTRILWSDNIITMDQEHSKFILATGFNHFHRGKMQKERMFVTFLGTGIFNRDDEIWKMHRSMARPFFARERISDFENFGKHTARTLSIISALEESNQACDAQDLYARFTIDSGSEFLFGKNLDTLSGTLPIAGETLMGAKGSATKDDWGTFTGAFDMVQQIVTRRARLGYLWPMFELFEDKTMPHVRIIRDWLDPLVKEALDDKDKRQAGFVGSPANVTFLQHLVENTEDQILIRDELLSMLLAARDTTACALTCITYFMAIAPQVAERLRAEVLEMCGPHAPATYERIKDLKYMRAVINEALRLFPPVPLNVRETRESSCVLPPSDPTYSGSQNDRMPLYMPGKTTVLYMPLIMQRNKALWGPDADEFDPDRWLQPERIAKFVANPSMFAPFSAGPRICVGQNYAYNEISYFLVKLLQTFDRFTLAPAAQPEGSLPPPEWRDRRGRQNTERIWPSAAMTLYIKGGMWVRFHKANP